MANDHTLVRQKYTPDQQIPLVKLSKHKQSHSSKLMLIYFHCITLCIILACGALPNGYIHVPQWIILFIIVDIPTLLLLRDIFDIIEYPLRHTRKLASKKKGCQIYLWTMFVIKIISALFIITEATRLIFIECCTLESINFYLLSVSYVTLLILSIYEILLIGI